MFFAKSTCGFYTRPIHDDNIPLDAVSITDEVYTSLINGQSSGKVISGDDEGFPVLSEPPMPSTDELSCRVRDERNRRVLCAIDAKSKYEREQSSISRSISVPNPMSESDYILVLQYLQDLFDIPQQSGFPWGGPDDPLCQWPNKPGFVRDTSIS